jgi:hypothetical protein
MAIAAGNDARGFDDMAVPARAFANQVMGAPDRLQLTHVQFPK